MQRLFFKTRIRMDIINIIAMVSNVIGVYLAARNNRYTWVLNFIASAALAAMFFFDHLYMSFSFNAYCGIMSIIGVMTWKKRAKQNDDTIVMGRSPIPHVAFFLLAILIITFNTEISNHPYVDSICTALSIVATYLLVKKDAWTWFYWIAGDIIYIFLGINTSDWKYYCVYGTVMLFDFYGAYRYMKLLRQKTATS